MAGKYFGIPFALSGDRTAIPDAAQPDGSVSFTQGFTLDYELENTDPNYKPVPREETNALYYDITEAIGIVQKQGFADWTVSAAPYPVNAFVRHNDIVWRNSVAANSAEPGTDSTWINSSTSIPAGIPTSGIRGSYSNLSASAVGTNATVTFTADAICVKNASNEQIVLNNVSESCNLLTSGAGGLDAGTIAGNTWYATYVIYNPTTLDVSAVASLSFTAPTLPSGYTHWAFIEAVRTNSGATQISPINMVNGICYYNPTAGTPIPSDFPIVVSAGTATSLTAISISAYVPPSAKSAILGHNCAGPAAGTSRLQMSSATASGLISIATATGNAVSGRIQVEFPNPQVFTPHYQVAGSGTTTVLVEGWRS